MNLNNKNVLKDPSEEELKFILKLFGSKRIIEAKKETLNKITKYPESCVLFNILDAIFAEQKQFNDAIENYKKSIAINARYAQA